MGEETPVTIFDHSDDDGDGDGDDDDDVYPEYLERKRKEDAMQSREWVRSKQEQKQEAAPEISVPPVRS